MTYKGYAAVVDFDAEDEVFAGRLAGIGDIVGFHAETVAGLKAAFREAVDDYLDVAMKSGKRPEKPFSGQIMVRVAPEVHANAARAAELSGKSLAKWTEEVLREAAERKVRAAVAI
jgi:predicted HicB family RNase H-like nuclease